MNLNRPHLIVFQLGLLLVILSLSAELITAKESRSGLKFQGLQKQYKSFQDIDLFVVNKSVSTIYLPYEGVYPTLQRYDSRSKNWVDVNNSLWCGNGRHLLQATGSQIIKAGKSHRLKISPRVYSVQKVQMVLTNEGEDVPVAGTYRIQVIYSMTAWEYKGRKLIREPERTLVATSPEFTIVP